MTFKLKRITQNDLPRLRRFWKENWGDEFVVACGVVYRPDNLDGFVAIEGNEWIGGITYHLLGSACEIISLDSLREGQGLGTLLIEKAIEAVRAKGCQRIFL